MQGPPPPSLSWGQKLLPAFFLTRLNRFLTLVRLREPMAPVSSSWPVRSGRPGPVVEAHLGDPGRLKEILVPGRPVFVKMTKVGRGGPEGPARKTAFSLVMADVDGVLVSLDSQAPNRLVRKALEMGYFPELASYSQVWPETQLGHSRLDFRLTGAPGAPDFFLEVKSVTLVQGGRALFPDAPTVRGARHMEALSLACQQGLRAAVMFIIQRADADEFSPHDQMDPAFGWALRQANASGVKIWAYGCQVTPSSISLLHPVPVKLDYQPD